MKSIGPGVKEIRVRDLDYVLHAFQKKTQQTSKRHLMIAETRFRTLRRSTPR
jgi:phage-related protein